MVERKGLEAVLGGCVTVSSGCDKALWPRQHKEKLTSTDGSRGIGVHDGRAEAEWLQQEAEFTFSCDVSTKQKEHAGQLGMVTHAFSPRTQEAEARRSL